MELGNDGLKIFYGKKAFTYHEDAMAFERELDQLCKRYELYRWASGQEVDTEIRDIAYDRLPPQ